MQSLGRFPPLWHVPFCFCLHDDNGRYAVAFLYTTSFKFGASGAVRLTYNEQSRAYFQAVLKPLVYPPSASGLQPGAWPLFGEKTRFSINSRMAGKCGDAVGLDILTAPDASLVL